MAACSGCEQRLARGALARRPERCRHVIAEALGLILREQRARVARDRGASCVGDPLGLHEGPRRRRGGALEQQQRSVLLGLAEAALEAAHEQPLRLPAHRDGLALQLGGAEAGVDGGRVDGRTSGVGAPLHFRGEAQVGLLAEQVEPPRATQGRAEAVLVPHAVFEDAVAERHLCALHAGPRGEPHHARARGRGLLEQRHEQRGEQEGRQHVGLQLHVVARLREHLRRQRHDAGVVHQHVELGHRASHQLGGERARGGGRRQVERRGRHDHLGAGRGGAPDLRCGGRRL
mmetsp:Transcript_6297/g.25294  ORF Transcript_6297/g.25294 Transcript_6297/m.25294 type:complete len:289 (-) Transcript_6297:285-1151(-)